MKKILNASAFLLLSLSFASFTASADVIPDHENLFRLYANDTAGKAPAMIHAENLKNYIDFVASDTDQELRDTDRPKYLRPEYAKHVIEQADSNPVVSLYQYEKYDPKNDGIGFCFGRAMFVHLELAHHQLDRDSIKRALVVGPMKTPDGGSWGWHVTTIAQSRDAAGNEIWIALDPITGPIELTRWYEAMREYSVDKKLKLYITTAGRFGVYASKYDHDELANQFYNGYFADMNTWFDNESRNTKHYHEKYREFDVK